MIRVGNVNEIQTGVANFIAEAITKSGKTQVEIAQEVGFQKPNMITMIKQGKSKLPMTKVKRLAESLSVDPKVLLRLCFEEYQPGNWMVIQDIFGADV
jgi:transcriptional regulator with XRE-family HTH domain